MSMAKKRKARTCSPARCKTVKGRRECSIMVSIGNTARCRPRRRDEFDPRSFRQIKSGKATILIGCPKGKYSARTGRCTVGTRGYKILYPKR